MKVKLYLQLLLVYTIIIVSAGISLGDGEFYRWVDNDGVVTYRDQPPPKTHKKHVKKYTDEDFSPDPPKPPPPKTVDSPDFQRPRKVIRLMGKPPSKAPGRSVPSSDVND